MLVGLVLWGVFTGLVFSAIGAAGGILTSFGLISLFGVMDPNSVKPMTQIVVLATALVFVRGYFMRRAMVLPLGLLLGAGGLAGAWLGSTLSSRYLADMSTFRPLFGLLTLAIAAQILWKLLRPGNRAGAVSAECVEGLCVTTAGLSFSYCQVAYKVPHWSPLLAGFAVAMTASVFGVGGGFLLVPYMASLLAMPMYIIPGTVAIALFMSLSVSIANFIALGAPIDWRLLLPLLAGAVIGAVLGPVLNKRMKNSWLQAGLAVVVLVIGLKYVFF